MTDAELPLVGVRVRAVTETVAGARHTVEGVLEGVSETAVTVLAEDGTPRVLPRTATTLTTP